MSSPLDANFSVLVTSIASAAAMSLGIAPNPQSGRTEIDLPMAKFNIDLLQVLREKTKNNLNKDEDDLIQFLLRDLQLKYVEKNKS